MRQQQPRLARESGARLEIEQQILTRSHLVVQVRGRGLFESALVRNVEHSRFAQPASLSEVLSDELERVAADE